MQINKPNTISNLLLHFDDNYNINDKYYFNNNYCYYEETVTTTSIPRITSSDILIKGNDTDDIVRQIGDFLENLIIKSDSLNKMVGINSINISLIKSKSKKIRKIINFKSVFLFLLRYKKNGYKNINFNKNEIDYLTKCLLNHPSSIEFLGLLKNDFIEVYNQIIKYKPELNDSNDMLDMGF
jgi:hypothetical protein